MKKIITIVVILGFSAVCLQGRFMGLDPMKDKFAGQSPYVFAGDNPINYIDFEGKFQLSPFDQKHYPRLKQILMNMSKLADNEELLKQFTIFTEAPKENLIRDLEWGNGPFIGIDPDIIDAYGEFNRNTTDNGWGFRLNKKYVDMYEHSCYENETIDLQFLMVVTVLHENIHFNDWEYDHIMNNLSDATMKANWGSGGGMIPELGDKFELRLFGKITPGEIEGKTFDLFNALEFQLNYKPENINFIVVPFNEIEDVNSNNGEEKK